jgi:hypothetical protein
LYILEQGITMTIDDRIEALTASPKTKGRIGGLEENQ